MRNKILILICLVLTACSSGVQLSKEFIADKRAWSGAYYDLRSAGMPFDGRFYNESDSIYAAMPKANQNLIRAFTLIGMMRVRDSLNLWTPADYKYNAALIDDNFYFAKGNAQ